MRTLPLAVLALCLGAAPAAAQQPTPTPTPGSPSMPMPQDTGAMRRPGGMQADSTSLAGLAQQALDALRGGLTSVPVATASSLVGRIETRLRATGRGALIAVASDLRALRRELDMPEVNGRRVGVILRRVGPKVTRVAATQGGAVRTTLRELGAQLSASGRELAAR